ncbi:RseA family anti-sigma factor [Aestuariibacter sp. AA17]|uniref:Anti-sigma-E factor RseA n=1 Tax=Fluctibacter corallii TaxID=2984329 RepID=A0ABT3A3N7_9ALTE|nr:RseA family anti-sigma factor [Aestuariibacter sp. AA17]MCV2883249.1 RseA family anti-sigma factor [Aestuariibacter sp. AA17]
MTQEHENLSAFVDGESQDSSLISALNDNESLNAKWQRYHLIRHSLRKEMPEFADFDISEQVANAIESEPAILAPKKTWRDVPVVASVVPFIKQGGQLAIAASVAAAVVIGVQQMNQPVDVGPMNSTPATLPGIKGGLSPVSLEETRTVPRTDVMEQRKVVNSFLTDHRNQLRMKAESLHNQDEALNGQEKGSPDNGESNNPQ